MKQYVDEVFGELNRVIFWEGKAVIPVIGDNVGLEVGTDGTPSPPTDAQREIYKAFCSVCTVELLDEIREAVYHYFSGRGYSLDRSSFWDRMFDPLVFVPAGVEKDPFLMVQWKNDIDDEYCVPVVWRENGSVRVGVEDSD